MGIGAGANCICLQYIKRVVHVAEIKSRFRLISARKRPTWPVPDRIRTNAGFHLRIGHAYIIVPRPVVNPNMVQAEPIKFAQMVPRYRRPVIARLGAIGPAAQARADVR